MRCARMEAQEHSLSSFKVFMAPRKDLPTKGFSKRGKEGVESCTSHVITLIAGLAYLGARGVGLVFRLTVFSFSSGEIQEEKQLVGEQINNSHSSSEGLAVRATREVRIQIPHPLKTPLKEE